MIILTLDIGNTTIGIHGVERVNSQDYRVVFAGKLPTERDQRKYSVLFKRFKKLLQDADIKPEDIEGAVLSSVVPDLNDPISQVVKDYTGRVPIRIGPECSSSLTFAIPNPELLGLDRIADAVWAVQQEKLPAITVDMGTATTFNILDKNGVFLGGLIAPGLETGLTALSSRTAQLPKLELSRFLDSSNLPRALIGRNTQECMYSGAINGSAVMIDGLVEQIEAELGQSVTLIMTGGWARLIHPLCRHAHIYDPELLPKGLALLYDSQNESKSV